MRIKLLDIILSLSTISLFTYLIFINQDSPLNPKKLVILHKEVSYIIPFKDNVIDFREKFNDISYKEYKIDKNIQLKIINGRASITYSDCPDKLCIHMGWIENCGDMIICMPNSFAVYIDCRGALDEIK